MRARRNDDEARSLNVLLGWRPVEPPYPTTLVEKCSVALAKPLKELDDEQIRLLISQGFGLEYVVPKAITILVRHPLIGVTFFDGDLLISCLKIDRKFWVDHPNLRFELDAILRSLDNTLEEVGEVRSEFNALWEG